MKGAAKDIVGIVWKRLYKGGKDETNVSKVWIYNRNS